MNILVTGGNGFIGQYVLRHLAKTDFGVVSMSRRMPPQHMSDLVGRVKFVSGDVSNPYDLVQTIRNEGVQRIIHMVSLGGVLCQSNPAAAYEVNIMGSKNVLEAARIMGVERVVWASSAAVYGHVDAEFLTEDAPRNPMSIYGITKLAVEHLGFTYAENWGLDFIAVRPSAGLGPYRTGGGGKKLNDVIEGALRGIPVRMKGGDQTYEMLHVSDSAKAFALAGTKDTVIHKAFHVGMGYRMPLREFADIVRRNVPGADIEIEPGLDRTGQDRTRTTQPPQDLTRARENGWVPDYTLESSIIELINSMRATISL